MPSLKQVDKEVKLQFENNSSFYSDDSTKVSIYEDNVRFKLTLSYMAFLYIIEHYRILNDYKPTNKELVDFLKDFTFYHPKKKVIPESHCHVESFQEQYIDMFYILKKQAIADILSSKSDEQIFKEWHYHPGS